MSLNKELRILVVDDDRQNLVSTKAYLDELDAEIDTTTSGKQAIYLINSRTYALLIFDVQMPEMDGYQLAEIIHSGYRNSKTPIIFISGVYYDEFDVFKGYDSGAVDYLTKPLNYKILRSKVQVFLELEKIKRELLLEKEKVQQALDDKTLFIAKVSHEVRNPLGVVISILDIFDEELSPEEKLEYLHIMKSSAGHMSRLLDDLVDYTKIELDGIELENIVFNIKNEVRYIVKGFGLQSKNTFSYSIDPNIPSTIIGDITRYKQIIYNLLGNANKFSTRGNIQINITKAGQSDQRITISTEIKDDGIGMTTEEQSELFKPFSQSNLTINRRFGGSGLGLTIAKKLSRVLGGDMHLISEKGKGSSFIFTAQFELAHQDAL